MNRTEGIVIACAIAILAGQVFTARWVKGIVRDSAYYHDNGAELSEIRKTIDSIDKRAESIEKEIIDSRPRTSLYEEFRRNR